MQKSLSQASTSGESRPGPGDKPPVAAPARASSLGFFVVLALVVLAAGSSLYLERRIRSVAAEIERLEGKQAAFSSDRAAGSSRPTNPFPAERPQAATDTEPAARERRKWTTDHTQMEQEWKRAVATMGPDLSLIRGAANRIRVRLRFHELYAILGLSEAEIAVFEKEAADKNLTFTQLLTPDPKSEEAHKQAQAITMDRIVADTLGRDYVEPFRAFLMTSDLRDLTADLAAFSLGAGEPLDPGQAGALLQTCLEFRQAGGDAVRIEPSQIDWESVAVRSQVFLTPAQQRLLRAMIDRRNFHQTFLDITGLPMHFPIRKLGSSSP